MGNCSVKAIAAVTLVLVALATNPASADKLDSSADFFLPRCRAVVNHDFNNLFDVGVCLGAMMALHDTPILLHVPVDAVRSCMADDVTVEQSVVVVVHWLDRHPQRLQENFVKLAMSALHEAWPCAE